MTLPGFQRWAPLAGFGLLRALQERVPVWQVREHGGVLPWNDGSSSSLECELAMNLPRRPLIGGSGFGRVFEHAKMAVLSAFLIDANHFLQTGCQYTPR